MAEHVLKVEVSWSGDNFCCFWSDSAAGTVVVTSKTLQSLKSDFGQSLKWHIDGCVSDGDVLPEYLVNGDYSIDYVLDAAVKAVN